MKTISKPIMALLAAGALGVGLSSQQAHAIVINFAAEPNSDVTFDGNTDKFIFSVGDNGFDFNVTSVVDGLGTSVGYQGLITGDFTIGAISSFGGLQSAPVTSVGGTISIYDGAVNLTGDIAWIEIFTFGTAGGLNAGGVINLSNLAYGGADSDLLALATLGGGTGAAALTFQFEPAKNLSTLTAAGASNATSYSGSLSSNRAVPDGGSTLALLGGALFGAAGLRRKLKGA